MAIESKQASEALQEPEYLDAPQLAAKLNVSLKSVINWTQARRLPVIKMGRVNRYPRIEIERRLLTGRLLLDKQSNG